MEIFKNNMKQNFYFLFFLGALFLLNGCTNAPNSITLTSNQGTCVQPGRYNSKVTPPPAITGNPTSAPYCMGITIQNNNSGMNANNIQITNLGLSMSYAVGTTSFGGMLYDPVAAQISIGGNQSYGNVGIYDPRNCVTSSGPNVTTLGTGGQKCTFYLQLSGESNPVGVYPITLTYNYTNGNQNYSVSTKINQRVYLYGGAASGLFYVSTNLLSATPAPAWQTGLAPTNSPVPYIIEANYGFVLFATANAVYVYNGANGASATQLGSNLPTTVSAVAFDTSNNVYAATTNSGIYVFNRNLATPAWMPLTDTTGLITASTNVTGLKGVEFTGQPNQLYAITVTNNAYLCNNLNITATGATCSCQLLNTPPLLVPSNFANNAIDVDQSGNLYAGYKSGVSLLSSGVWQPPYAITSIITGTVSGVNWVAPVTPTAPAILYFGETGATVAGENSVYSCNLTSNTCTVLSSSKSNGITGNANSVTTDGMGNVCATGQMLNSLDYVSSASNVTAACLLNISTPKTATWIPIANGSLSVAPVQFGIIASMLTSY